VKIFIDNCLPPRWAPALSALAEVEAAHLRHKFQADIEDIDWIRILGDEGGWTIISGDARITKLRHEKEAWLNSGLTAFFLVKGWDLPFWDKTSLMVRWMPKILEQTRMVQPGAGFYVPVNFKNGKFEQVPLSRRTK
jgi:hypothetical protein